MISDHPTKEMKDFIDSKIIPALSEKPARQLFGPESLGRLDTPTKKAFPALMWLVYGQRLNMHILPTADAPYLALAENMTSPETILFVKVDGEDLETRRRVVTELVEATGKAIGEYCGPKKMGFLIPDLVNYCRRQAVSDTQLISKVAKASFQDILYVVEHLMIRKIPIEVKGRPCFVELLFHEGFPIRDFYLREKLTEL